MRFMRITAAALGANAATAQELAIGVRGGPESMDPHYSALGVHAEAMRHVFDTLIAVDEDLRLQPSLAVSREPIDDLVWEFKLREGVTFHDGSEFTAEDVVASIERIPEVTGPTTMEIYVRRVAETEIVDPHTLRIATNAPATTLPHDFTRLFVVSSEAVEGCNTPETAAEC